MSKEIKKPSQKLYNKNEKSFWDRMREISERKRPSNRNKRKKEAIRSWIDRKNKQGDK